jgi:C-terminal processing protease CtpA/Prc
MYIRRVDNDTEPGLKEALAKVPDAKGWVVDLCGNGGGGYENSLVEAVKAMPRPVAVVIDEGCISAGETLARDLAKGAGARLFGSKTAGSSTAKQHWTFPSGIASVTLSVRSRWRLDNKPIEFNGIDPDEPVEAVPEEVARGLNSAICRAEAYLKKR